MPRLLAVGTICFVSGWVCSFVSSKADPSRARSPFVTEEAHLRESVAVPLCGTQGSEPADTGYREEDADVSEGSGASADSEPEAISREALFTLVFEHLRTSPDETYEDILERASNSSANGYRDQILISGIAIAGTPDPHDDALRFLGDDIINGHDIAAARYLKNNVAESTLTELERLFDRKAFPNNFPAAVALASIDETIYLRIWAEQAHNHLACIFRVHGVRTGVLPHLAWCRNANMDPRWPHRNEG